MHSALSHLELLEVAINRHDIRMQCLVVGDGRALPYADGAFDAVMATGVLHHIEEPRVVTEEMLRVARKVILISDNNTYGLGWLPYRLLKVLAREFGLGGRLDTLRHGGHRWFYSEGDGYAYLHSVFDDVRFIRPESADVMVLTTAGEHRREELPLVTTTHALILATKRQ